MRKLTQLLTISALAAGLSLGATALDSRPATADLKIFNGFDSPCTGECPVGAEDGECCAIAPPIIVEG